MKNFNEGEKSYIGNARKIATKGITITMTNELKKLQGNEINEPMRMQIKFKNHFKLLIEVQMCKFKFLVKTSNWFPYTKF